MRAGFAVEHGEEGLEDDLALAARVRSWLYAESARAGQAVEESEVGAFPG